MESSISSLLRKKKPKKYLSDGGKLKLPDVGLSGGGTSSDSRRRIWAFACSDYGGAERVVVGVFARPFDYGRGEGEAPSSGEGLELLLSPTPVNCGDLPALGWYEDQRVSTKKMDHNGKIEAAISNFRHKKRTENEEKLRAKVTEQELQSNTCVVSGQALVQKPICKNATTSLNSNKGKNDPTMDEFDRFVLYENLKKQTEVLTEQQNGNEVIILNNHVEDINYDQAARAPSNQVLVTEKSGETASTVGSEVLPEESAIDLTKVVLSEESVKLATLDSSEVLREEREMATLDSWEVLRAEREIDLDKVAEILGEELGGGSEEQSDSDDDLVSRKEEYVFPTPDEVNNAKPPKVGMVFPTLEAAVKFVNVYGKLAGFAVIKGRNYKSRKITLECNKSRKTRTKNPTERQRKRNVLAKTNCHMHVRVKVVVTS